MKKYFLLGLILLVIGWFATLPYRVKQRLLNSEQFHVSKEHLKGDTILISEIGNIKSIGDNITGKLDERNNIHHFDFDVEGEEGIRRVHINLEKSNNGWKVIRKNIYKKNDPTPADTGERN